MNDLAVVIMAYNEAEVLERCLLSVAPLACEVHVSIDTASTDASQEVALRYATQVYAHRGLPADAPEQDDPQAVNALNSYSRMRNDVLDAVEEHSTAQWFMWLDADEVLEEWGGIQELLAAMPEGAAGLQCRMNLYGGEQLIAVQRNTKVIARGTRFTRRRHEHITNGGLQVPADSVIIGHKPSQPAEVREAHDRRKLQHEAFIADWQEFGDARSAFYCGDYWRTQNHPEEALAWYERGLAMPHDTPQCPPAQRSILALMAGRVCEVLGRLPQARRHYLDTLGCDWQFGEAAHRLGEIAAKCHRWPEAEHWFKIALVYPDQPGSLMQQAQGVSTYLPVYGLACVAAARGNRVEAYRLLAETEKLAGGALLVANDLRKQLDEVG